MTLVSNPLRLITVSALLVALGGCASTAAPVGEPGKMTVNSSAPLLPSVLFLERPSAFKVGTASRLISI